MDEAQKLHTKVIALRSGICVEGVGARLGVVNHNPEGPILRHGEPGCQSGISSDRVESSDSWHKRAREGGWTGKAGIGVNDGVSPLLYK